MNKSYVLFELSIVILLWVNFALCHRPLGGEQPLSKIDILNATLALHDDASIKASPALLGLKGEDTEWVNVELQSPNPSSDDWVGVFSPAKINSSSCYSAIDTKDQMPYICSAPIKYKFASTSSSDFMKTGKVTLRFQIINQRADISFGLFSGGLSSPKLIAASNFISFANPKAPLYPRLALGKSWNEICYFDRVELGLKTVSRNIPLLVMWTNKNLKVRYKEDTKVGGYDKGLVIDKMKINEVTKERDDEDSNSKKKKVTTDFLYTIVIVTIICNLHDKSL